MLAELGWGGGQASRQATEADGEKINPNNGKSRNNVEQIIGIIG